jgi:rhodanese-related sulfurtransferase
MRKLCRAAVLLFLVASLAAAGPARGEGEVPATIPGVTTVTAEEVLGLVDRTQGLVIIDSRLAAEAERGIIEGAVNLPNTELSAQKLAAVVAPDRPVLFYCNGVHCPRSQDACTKAVAWGWRQVYWFRGGVAEWTQKGFPLSRPQ